MKLEFEVSAKDGEFLQTLANEHTDGDVTKFVKREFNKVIECLKDLKKDGQI